MSRGLFILVVFLIGFQSLKAQIDQVWRYTYPEFVDGEDNKLFFRLENNNFFKNNEYFGDYTEGYTLIGYTVQPTFMYYAGSRLRIKAGAHILQYSGAAEFTKAVPIFSVHTKLNDHLSLIMGSLRGDVHHRMLEPLFNPENQYSRPVENGVQFLYNKNRTWFDIWLDWEQFIVLGDEKPEKFTAGISAEYDLSASESDWKFSIPFQFIATHLGGQISDYEERMQSLTNIATGLKMNKKVGDGFVQNIGFSAYGAIYKDLTEASGLPFSSGKAIYPVGELGLKHGLFMLGYWYANNFVSPKGSALFQSISDYNADLYQKERNLVTAKLIYTKDFLKKIHFSAVFETYFDVPSSQLEYTYGFNLVFNPTFFISKVKFE